MQNLRNPKWIFICNTLPSVILIFLLYREYQVINSLLTPESTALWHVYGWTLVGFTLLNIGYAFYCIYKKKQVSLLYGCTALLLYIVYLYLYSFDYGIMVPFSIPSWIISSDLHWYAGTFLMPTLAYAVFILVFYFTKPEKEHKAWKNFLVAVLIPIAWYVFTQIILPLWQPIGSDFELHTFLILLVISTLFFLFFLIRAVYILIQKNEKDWEKYQLAWKIPVTIILPLLGLHINNEGYLNYFTMNGTGTFGNYSNHWFYILALLNGILLCVPDVKQKTLRLILLFLRSITFSFTLYFFLVFLPFMPVSIIAIIFVGAGFLMLSPLLIFVIHAHQISKDITYLKEYVSFKIVTPIMIIGFLSIPLIITNSYLKDKYTIEDTLSYIYQPEYSKESHIDKTTLKNTLEVVKKHKGSGFIFDAFNQTPYLSSYYKWLVFDNLTLSDSKIAKIEEVFFGETNTYTSSNNRDKEDYVKISNVSSNSRYDENQKAWVSWIDLEITNESTYNSFAEYSTVFELPEGSWISDYYLYVGTRKEMGLLTEKKAAMWVYSQIYNENKDPGILYYKTGNKIAFRVFPFNTGEKRKTGIQLLHKDPMQFEIDGHVVSLGDSNLQLTNTSFENEQIAYVSAPKKRTLPTVKRTPYFHFLVDISMHANGNDHIKKIEALLEKHPDLFNHAKISLVNTYTSTYDFNDDWKELLFSKTYEGGYFLERAIKKVLTQSFNTSETHYPVLVSITNYLPEAILEKDFSNLEMIFPESPLFYSVPYEELFAHSLVNHPKNYVKDFSLPNFNHTVKAYTFKDGSKTYLVNDSIPSLAYKATVYKNSTKEAKEKNWESGINMHAQWASQILHPETAEQEWLPMVKQSFLSKIMSPVTSYIVVESEAQKAALLRKQAQILAGNSLLDPNEDVLRMSEPGILVLIGLFLVFLLLKKRRILKLF
jgi:hypothetical protein